LKPFIHLFETPKNYYFYDVNKNQNICVDKELYFYLTELLKDENVEVPNEEIKSKIKELKEDGYLSENRVEKIYHPETENLETYLERQIDMLIIQLTHLCNLRCSYCSYTSNDGTGRLHGNKTISFDIAKKSIDFYRDRSVDSETATLNFYGGEPLLEFELFKKCVDYFEYAFKGKKRSFLITTNGTMLTSNVANYLESKDFKVLVSLDGPKTTNDKNRKFANSDKSVFDLVVKNLSKIKDENKKLFSNLSINMVLDPSLPFHDYYSIFDEYPFFRDIAIRMTIIDDSNLINKVKMSQEFLRGYGYHRFLSYLHSLGRIDLSDRLYTIDNFIGENVNILNGLILQKTLGKVNAPGGPCIPGKTRLMVDVDGNFFPCERVSELIDRHCIGDVFTGFKYDKALNILNIANDVKYDCKDCFAFRQCSICIKAHECRNIDPKLIMHECNSSRGNFHNKLIAMEIVNEIRTGELDTKGSRMAESEVLS